MRPELLVFLLLAAANSATLMEDSTGLNFILAFPENIAYYYPAKPDNKVQITAMHDNTKVTLKMHTHDTKEENLNSGQTKEFEIHEKMEVRRSDKVLDETLQITSTKNITVHAINHKKNSMQTAVVIPTDRLGTEYLIPPVPKIEGTSFPAHVVTTEVAERRPFKLIIVNADEQNKVTVKGKQDEVVSLQPHQLAQFWVTEDNEFQSVKATQPVAVLFGHTCAMRNNCTCGQLYVLLPPAQEENLKFYIPPALAKDAESETFVLLSEKQSTKIEAYYPNSPLVETAGTAILFRPGLLLTLIPEKDFAACYVVNSIPDTTNYAVIMVHKDLTDGIHVRDVPLQGADWQEVKGTDYVSTATKLAAGKSIIWHDSSNMAVYFVGTKEGALFGNPASIISRTPDFRGCVLAPEVLKIGEVAGGWRESLQYCKDNDLELISFAEARLQTQVYEKIVAAKIGSLQLVWIGLRRSSQSGEWYWLNGDPVSDTNWDEGEPGAVHDGQCAIMSVEEGEGFSWRDEVCCKAAHPVCYKEPVLLPVT